MKNKIKILTALFCIMFYAAPAFAAKTTFADELKAGAVFLFKMSIGVIASAIIIGFGLWFYSRINTKKEMKSDDSKAGNFTCEIDETKTIDEAIKTFLKINEK